MQRHTKPLPWRAKGISDTLDASTAFTGAMLALTNLIPDPSTANLWQCRPAAVKIFPPSSGAAGGLNFSSAANSQYIVLMGLM